MFVTQKMILLDVLVLQKDVEDVSQLIVESGYFEPSVFSTLALDTDKQWQHENTVDKKKIIAVLQKTVDELQSYFGQYYLDPVKRENDTILAIPIIGDTLRQYKTKKDQFESRAQLIRKQKEEIAIKIAGLRMYLETQQKHQNILKNSENFHAMLGLINTNNLPLLENEFHRFEGELATEGHVNDSEIIFIAVPKDQKTELTAVLEQLYYIDHGLPDEFFGEGTANMMKLGFEYTLVCDQEEMLEFEIKKLAPIILEKLLCAYDSLGLYTKISEIRQSLRQAGHFALLSGWIASNKFKSFKAALQKTCQDNFELTITEADTFTIQLDIPTELSNPKIFKPFEQLVTTFGMPNYKEIDPTPIFAILYVFMYGAMFGDVGQGALLFFLGLGGKIFKKKSPFMMIFEIMIWVGISSTIFGFLYGSYFGYEKLAGYNVPAALWLSPMHNINAILMYATIFGVFVICFSYFLGVINTIRMRDWGGLFFSHKGLTAFIVYLIVLVMAYTAFLGEPIPLPLIVVFGALSLFLGLERVWEALIYGHGSIKDWWMGIFDMFEFFLSMLTNTLSFVRIGAFALTHAALMMAVFTLRDLAGGDTVMAYVTVIIGNIFVIGMEGFIVGIQTLRLEYYEFFMRFFKGSGRIFNPITYKK